MGGWMWSCLSSAKFSVLVNGVPAGFFPSTKGLRQGDPLSPYLFIMGMEVLDVLIREAVEGGSYQDATLGEKWPSLNISHLMPKVVVRRIEKVQRDFLWGGRNMERKVHLVKWEVVCTDKDKGGLGLRKLALLNKALLGKWIWRKGQHDMLLDRCVVLRFLIGSTLPSSIWYGCAHKSLTVEEMWDQNSGQGNWNLHFLRDFNDWEIELVGEFLHILRGLNLLWRKIQLYGEKEEVASSGLRKRTGC
ncbi:hypothetical protein CK203_048012 [Vitis vinifera]|uniref:Uncharacterized protein n=1 Tax=Vitis vinifera TaxID=29760 RepID=A0A438GH42_VITVI|nr:hypothetical protein CK203_048012 [Vitis vinifera]